MIVLVCMWWDGDGTQQLLGPSLGPLLLQFQFPMRMSRMYPVEGARWKRQLQQLRLGENKITMVASHLLSHWWWYGDPHIIIIMTTTKTPTTTMNRWLQMIVSWMKWQQRPSSWNGDGNRTMALLFGSTQGLWSKPIMIHGGSPAPFSSPSPESCMVPVFG